LACLNNFGRIRAKKVEKIKDVSDDAVTRKLRYRNTQNRPCRSLEMSGINFGAT
jgi:hypothetical protein